MGQCLEEYRRKIGLYNTHFHGRNIMVPKRQSRVTMDPMPALTVIVLVCCAVAALGWADYSPKALADMGGFTCWTGHCSVTSHVNMSVTFSSSPHGCCTGQGSVNADINIVLTATHYTTSDQHGSMAALNNIGQLIIHGHYSELRIIHSGDVQPNPGPVSGSSQGLTPGASSSLASAMPKGLKIGQWNVQSLYNKTEQMRQILDAEGNNIHILGITETWLNNSHSDSEIAIHGYNLERRDRTECHGGGVAVYVHESVTYARCPDLESDAVEALVICVSFPHAKSMFIAMVYRPPSAPVAGYGVLDDFMDRLCAQECELVLMGDINIDILNGMHTAPSAWQDIIDGHQLTQIVRDPTRVTEDTQTLIDHIYVSHPGNVKACKVSTIALRDHYPVCL